jgi:predicted oxidoreductase
MTGSGELASRLDEVATAQGVDRAAVAVAFLLRHPAKILPVMGTNNLARIATISDAQKVELDRQTWFRLYEAALGREVA